MKRSVLSKSKPLVGSFVVFAMWGFLVVSNAGDALASQYQVEVSGPSEVLSGENSGWLPKLEHAGFAEMVRGGIYYRFSERVGIGAEFTHQAIMQSDFRFNSLGSMMTFRL